MKKREIITKKGNKIEIIIQTQQEKKLELLKLYNEFLKNYNTLNEMFDLRSPAEIEALFCKLLKKGYLSAGHDLTIYDKVKEFKDFYNYPEDSNIFNGASVDRNIPILLVDILDNYGFNAYKVSANRKFNLRNDEGKFKSFWELSEMLGDKIDSEESLTDIALDSINPNIGIPVGIVINRGKHIVYGDTTITITSYNGHSYILNPIDGISKGKYLLYKDDMIKPNYVSSRILFGNKKNEIKKILSLPISNEKIDDEEIRRVNSLFEENKDIFMEFHKRNKELIKCLDENTSRLKR